MAYALQRSFLVVTDNFIAGDHVIDLYCYSFVCVCKEYLKKFQLDLHEKLHAMHAGSF